MPNGNGAATDVSVPFTSGSSLQPFLLAVSPGEAAVSVPFTSGSSLQPDERKELIESLKWVSVPFTSGSSLQLYSQDALKAERRRFSSLYIGILAATVCNFLPRLDLGVVSVPFTSGSSLQRKVIS